MISSNLLQALLSPDGNIRSQAETAFHSLSVTDRVQGLLTELQNNDNNNGVKMIASVLLRRDILKVTDPSLLQQLVNPLLQAFQTTRSPANNDISSSVGHCLAEVCASLSLLGGDVDATLQNILTHVDTNQISDLKLLAQLADRAPMAFAKLAVPSLPNLLASSVSNNSNNMDNMMESWAQILVNAAIATTVTKVELVRTPVALDDLCADPNSPAAALGTGPLRAHVLPWMLATKHLDALRSTLGHFSEAASACPSLLSANPALLEDVAKVCLQLATATGQPDAGSFTTTTDDVRLAAMEVLTSVLSVGDVKRRVLPPALASTIATAALPVCAQLLVEGTDENVQDWAAEPATLVDDAFDGSDEDEQAWFAESLMAAFLHHLGAPALQVVLPLCERLLASSDWAGAHAGLAILECAVEATPVSVAVHTEVIVNAAASLAASPNVRVQHRALRLLGVLCGAPQQQLQPHHAKLLLESLAGGLSSPCSKVSATASLSLVSFCRGTEDAETATMPYFSDLVMALVRGPLSLMENDTGSVTTRVRAMGATACLAQTVGEAFTPLYPQIMPGLLATAQQPVVELAGAAVEAASIIGQAVGKSVFYADAVQLLSWIVPTLASNPIEALLLACARIASVLEEEFGPYTNAVLPVLLRQAEQPPDVSVMEGEEGSMQQQEDSDDSMTVAVPGRGIVKVSINTTKIQEKAQAARAVYELAKAMGAAFGPWAQQCLDTFLPLVSFPYSADVRSTAAQTLSAIFDAACAQGEEIGSMALPQRYLPLLAEAISKQIATESPTDLEAMYALGDSLSEVFYIVFRYRSDHPDILANYLLANHAEGSVHACVTALQACLERRADLTRVMTGQLTGEDEKEEYNGLLEQEENLLTPLVDSVGYNLKFFREAFVPLFEQTILPTLGASLTSMTDIRATISAVLLFDDCVEHCGPDAAAKYAPKLLEGISCALSTDDKDLVQAAVYGVAQIARKAPNAISMDQCLLIVQKLLQLCSQTKDDDHAYLIEISAAALASLTLFGSFPDLNGVSREVLVTSFLSQLPIQQDDDEAKICHAQFCSLVESGAVDLNASNAGHISQICGTILTDVQEGEDVATPETSERLAAILYKMQQSGKLLDADKQGVVSRVLQDVARSRMRFATP